MFLDNCRIRVAVLRTRKYFFRIRIWILPVRSIRIRIMDPDPYSGSLMSGHYGSGSDSTSPFRFGSVSAESRYRYRIRTFCSDVNICRDSLHSHEKELERTSQNIKECVICLSFPFIIIFSWCDFAHGAPPPRTPTVLCWSFHVNFISGVFRDAAKIWG